jgi:hypothetical protein
MHRRDHHEALRALRHRRVLRRGDVLRRGRVDGVPDVCRGDVLGRGERDGVRQLSGGPGVRDPHRRCRDGRRAKLPGACVCRWCIVHCVPPGHSRGRAGDWGRWQWWLQCWCRGGCRRADLLSRLHVCCRDICSHSGDGWCCGINYWTWQRWYSKQHRQFIQSHRRGGRGHVFRKH